MPNYEAPGRAGQPPVSQKAEAGLGSGERPTVTSWSLEEHQYRFPVRKSLSRMGMWENSEISKCVPRDSIQKSLLRAQGGRQAAELLQGTQQRHGGQSTPPGEIQRAPTSREGAEPGAPRAGAWWETPARVATRGSWKPAGSSEALRQWLWVSLSLSCLPPPPLSPCPHT